MSGSSDRPARCLGGQVRSLGYIDPRPLMFAWDQKTSQGMVTEISIFMDEESGPNIHGKLRVNLELALLSLSLSHPMPPHAPWSKLDEKFCMILTPRCLLGCEGRENWCMYMKQ